MKKLVLVDGNSLMYRAYYGMAAGSAISQNSQGMYVNAVYAFARMINNLASRGYDSMLVAFDAGKKTFRHDIVSSYKDGRSKMPDEMRSQITYIKDFLRKKNIAQYELSLYEADDIIGTMAKMGKDNGYHVDVYSSDKDLLQLIDDNVTVHLTKRGMTDLEDYDKNYFREKYNLEVEQFIDLKSLMGDSSDNLSGIPGVGPKTAQKLLSEYGTLENIISNIDNLKGSVKKKFEEHSDMAVTTKKMVTILEDAPIEITLDDCAFKEENKSELLDFYKKMEFSSLIKDLTSTMSSLKPKEIEYKVINTKSEIKLALDDFSTMVFETGYYNYHKSDLLAIGIANKKGLFIINPEVIRDSLDFKLFLEDDENHKDVYDYKRSSVLASRAGLKLLGVDFDLLLATYLLTPSLKTSEFRNLANFYSYYDVPYEDNVYGKGAKFAIPDEKTLYNYIAKKTYACYKLKNIAYSRLEENNQISLLKEIEIPLSLTLSKMEYAGIKVDFEELNKQKENLQARILILEQEIYTLANKEFNISSPKQLGIVLFDDLGLPYPKKKKSGYSTAAAILDDLAPNYDIVKKVLEYRGLTKLYSTYIEGIAASACSDGLVHTIFEQTLTQTGRLSSIEPNLQNIPIRTEEGKNIRKFFIPKNKGNKFLSADYSQIELRVLAHMAGVEHMKEAFNNGEDIHSATAKAIFNKNEITKNDRYRAKAVNFGIVYGISAFSLAKDVGISNYEAKEFIDKYNSIFPEIKVFMNQIIEFAKVNGYVKTIKNRIRQIPDINSKVFQVREFAKRTAMNAPIQGSAADIIKIAMINIDKALEKGNYKSKMLVTVHDEVVLEVLEEELDSVTKLVVDCMENAIKLDVKLKVDYSFGANWYEVK